MTSPSRAVAAASRLVALWAGTPVGTPVLVRRDDGSTIQTVTRSRSFLFRNTIPAIVVDGIPGAFPLDHVSLAGPPATQLPIPLDPEPTPREFADVLGEAFVAAFFLAAVGGGLLAIASAALDWGLR